MTGVKTWRPCLEWMAGRRCSTPLVVPNRIAPHNLGAGFNDNTEEEDWRRVGVKDKGERERVTREVANQRGESGRGGLGEWGLLGKSVKVSRQDIAAQVTFEAFNVRG